MTNENASAGGTERAAVENKANLSSPVDAGEQNSIANWSPLKSETPLSVLGTPPVLPSSNTVQRKREQQHQERQQDSSSGSGIVRSNIVDHKSTPTVAVQRCPELPDSTAISSVFIQASSVDTNKSGACGAGCDGAGSPNPGDVVTTPTGSACPGLTVDIGATGTPYIGNVQPAPINTPQLDRMEWGESKVVDGRSRDTSHVQSVPSPRHSNSLVPSSPKYPVGGLTASAQRGPYRPNGILHGSVTSKNSIVNNAENLEDEKESRALPRSALVLNAVSNSEGGLGPITKSDQAQQLAASSPSTSAAMLQESTGQRGFHEGLVQGPFSTTSEDSATESAPENPRYIPIVSESDTAKKVETPIRDPPPLKDQHSSPDLGINTEAIQNVDNVTVNQASNESICFPPSHGHKTELDAGKIDADSDTDTVIHQAMITLICSTRGINFDCDSDNGLVQANESTDSAGNVVHTEETV